ncbi:TetR family transcriptional regulator [Variovorax sp. J31P179]|uniref:TetR family transcriptional regulator n=1 Tax=Variovorax sp. J31P179 TaxID=3053508 RepID=UPI002578EF25|nr:TetR family transcriptional regulator [Variovorax sp. J31P179]MDM0085118.1 TetR family transcriptional regulator [Variovorax sp. J31P179]
MAVKTTQNKRHVKPRGPGRPEGTSEVRAEILDAAEDVFSTLGYAGTSLREVAEKAKVTQALISYYFGSKFGLFEQVFLRRSAPISEERIERLEALQQRGKADAKEIVRAFLLPTVSLRNSPQGRAFLRLQARLHTEPPEISYDLRTQAYGDSTRLYVEALRAALPKLGELDAYWRVTMMIGTYLYAFSDTHRMEEMAPSGVYDPADAESLIDQVTRFVVGGFEAR